MLAAVKHRAEQTAKKAGLFTAASLFLFVGFGFLTLASWMYLITVMAPLEAALLLSLVFLGVGGILFGMAMRGDNSPAAPRAALDDNAASETPSNAPPLMQAFLHGMEAGTRAKR